MYEYAELHFGKVDIWINNAGMNQNMENIYNHNIKRMHQIIDVNIKGVLNGTRVACEKMMANGGFIYNMEGFGSDGMIQDKMSLYGMTKRALTYYTKSASKEVETTKVKICFLSPGMVITDLMTSSLPEDPAVRSNFIKILNILGDKVEVVTPYLVKGILANKKNGGKVAWLTKTKVFTRFASQMFRKRKIVDLE
jgi:short-subunit dehydrogenase